MDLEFFEETEAVKARTVGKFVRKDFVRGSGVSNAPVDLNGVEATLPSKKSHKTGKKAVKSRTQWTAVSH